MPTESVTELPSTVNDDILVVLDLSLTSLLIVALESCLQSKLSSPPYSAWSPYSLTAGMRTLNL